MCGIDALNPKFMPDANNIKLLGPGVMDETNANRLNATTRSVMVLVCTKTRTGGSAGAGSDAALV
jgi:hypothetical protein